jgi:hypothetical protein
MKKRKKKKIQEVGDITEIRKIVIYGTGTVIASEMYR